MASLIKRGSIYYLQWYDGADKRRRSLQTDSLQIAKERCRQFESARLRGADCPFPTRTPVGEIVAAYIDHMRAHRPERSWRRDLSYLREAFGECCRELELTTSRARKCRDHRNPEDRRRKLRPLEAPCFEAITTAQIADFIGERVRARGLAPKTANRYREVIGKVFNWAIDSERIRTPNGTNPIAKVARYAEPAPVIEYLTLEDIRVQLEVLEPHPVLQGIVATMIFAGLRREEVLWLRRGDLLQPTTQAPYGVMQIRARAEDQRSWQPKTRSNRCVPISQSLRAHVARAIVRPACSAYLFPADGGARWDPDNLSSRLRRVNSEAGLRWSSLHYRHTFGSHLAQRGLSLFQIATLMGNSPEICRRHYAALVPGSMTDLINF